MLSITDSHDYDNLCDIPLHPVPVRFSVADINHTYNGSGDSKVECLRDINLTVLDHEFLSIVGPSGCGKSSLLNIMSGLIKPLSGKVLLDGIQLSGITQKIGYISQSDSLLPWRTVLGNIEFGLELKGLPKKHRHEIARDLVAKAGLEGFEKSYPFELSVGMRKRVDIIRILALGPEVIFMDEPFGALDVFTREMLQDYILSLWHETQKTIIFITHDLGEAITLADRVIIMTARPGTIKSEYAITLPRPRSSLEIRFNQESIYLHKRIWEDLKDEVKTGNDSVLKKTTTL